MTTTTQRLKQTQSASTINSSDHRPTVVLCSGNDEFLLSQDICTLCGSIGKADEGNLICCSQCGQCYHPYCVNIKGLKVVISKGWRCLECTVCETCGQPGDEAKLLLCDECEFSCHTYCLKPPLEDVPQGAWKCKWCMVCQRCGSQTPGTNSDWQKNYTECGPCSSLSTCPKCKIDYNLDDLIIQCNYCSRWLHAQCDSIRDDEECELALELGYTCLMCRPKDEIPLYLLRRKSTTTTAKTPDQRESSSSHDVASYRNTNPYSTCLSKHLQLEFPRPQSAPLASSATESNNTLSMKRPASSLHFSTDSTANLTNLRNDDNSNVDDQTTDITIRPQSKTTDDFLPALHMVDGVYLTEMGFNFIKSQKLEPAKRQRAKRGTKSQKLDENGLDEINRDDDDENKLNSEDKVDEDGKKKRVRKLSKLGVGGFAVRQRGIRVNKDVEANLSLINDADTSTSFPTPQNQSSGVQNNQTQSNDPLASSKPKRIRKKPKKKANLIDQYPSYLQEAFFGKTLLTDAESKLIETKNRETSNDCSNMDLSIESSDLFKSFNDTDSKRRSTDPNKPSDLNDLLDNQISDIKLEANKEGDLIDVFINEQSNDSKKDDFDPDFLNADFNLDMVDPLDSKDVEDLLNGLGGSQPAPQVNQEPGPPPNMPAPQIMSPALKPITDGVNHYDNSNQNTMLVQTPSPRVQFCRPPPPPQNPMMQPASRLRQPMMDSQRMQDPYSMPPNTPRPISIQQRSPFSPQSPFPQHHGSMASSTPPITPRTPTEHQQMFPPSQQMSMASGHQQQALPPPSPLQQPSMDSSQVRMAQAGPYQAQQQAPAPYQNQQSMDASQKAIQDFLADEILGAKATKSATLYANLEHPNLKLEYRSAEERHKQIHKLWRHLTLEQRKPYNERARENRSAMKVLSKSAGESAPKKSESPAQHMQKQHHEPINQPPQQVFMNSPTMIQQPQEAGWRQPAPLDAPQGGRYMSSPHMVPASHMNSTPPQPISPSIRTMSEGSASHYEHSPQTMMPAQTPSPQMQFVRPPSHQMMQVSRIRPPLDSNRVANQDPYAMPPSTPRPIPIQQRSPFSPQSPFPQHQGPTASSTPPVNPRTPNEQLMYPTNQHANMTVGPNQQVAAANHHQQQQHQSSFADPTQVHVQGQPVQYNQVRHMQYTNQTRMNSMQYGNQAVRGPTVNRAPQMANQQQIYQQSQYRQPQAVRYANQVPDSQHMTMQQQVMSPQLMQQQRAQGPMIARQMGQVGQPRMMNQPRQQHHTMQGQAAMHSNQHQISNTLVQQQPNQQQQVVHQGMGHNQQHMQQPQSSIQTQSHLQVQQVHYNNIQTNTRIDTDEQIPLLEDEDTLKDLGADFNILEFADPEPDKGGSTSAGKNNIDLDPEFEDFFDDKDTLDEKRSVDQMLQQPPVMQVQQHPQQQQQISQQIHAQPPHQQVVYQPMHNQAQPVPNQNFVDSQQQHSGLQHPSMGPQQNQYSQPRQPQFNNQPRMVAGNQQYAPNQQQIIRANPMQGGQVRMQHPQQQISYVQQRPQQRYQSPTGHEMHQHHGHLQPQPQQQNVMHQPQQVNSNQIVRSNQMAPQHQYQNQTNFVENTPQTVGHMNHHHNQVQQQQQYSSQQHPQQQNMMYVNHPQMNNPRRQFVQQQQQQQQPQQQQQQQQQQQIHQQNYVYQQPQQIQSNYQQIPNNHPQQMMDSSNDLMIHDKNPIVGESMTSMEFTMFEQGSGRNNEAVNFPVTTGESQNLTSANHEDVNMSSSSNDLSHNQIEFGQTATPQYQASVSSDNVPIISNDLRIENEISLVSQDQATEVTNENNDNSFKYSTGRLSSCSNPQEGFENSQSNSSQQASCPERSSGGSQAQNQLLKQLLATCSSADSPNQDATTSQDSSHKEPTVQTIPSIAPKQVPSGIPTISFQMDPLNKVSGPSVPSITNQQTLIRTSPVINQAFNVQSRPNVAPTQPLHGNIEVKTYNVSQQVQPSATNTSGKPIMRVQQLPAQVSSAPMIQIRSEGQIISRPEPSSQQQQYTKQTDLQAQSLDSEFAGRANIGVTIATNPMLAENQMENPSTLLVSNLQPGEAQPLSAKAKRKSDYMAKRRADLEKEPTPPPKEVKPKKRVRGPNKRSRVDNNDETKTIDSNSNTSETSQLPDFNQGPPPRKRVRKSHKNKLDLESTESQLSNLVNRIHADLPDLKVREPDVNINNNISTLFACGDLNSRSSSLRGYFGRGVPVSDLTQSSSKKDRRKLVGYYHEEFPLENGSTIDECEDQSYNLMGRDCDSPASIISGSSSDNEDSNSCSYGANADDLDGTSCYYTPNLLNYKSSFKNCQNNSAIIHCAREIDSTMDLNNNTRPISPSIPVSIKLPTAHVSISDLSILHQNESDDNNKENRSESSAPALAPSEPSDICQISDQTSTSLSMRLKDANVSVTLTLTNEEADGVKRVLNKLSKLIEQPTQSSSSSDQAVANCQSDDRTSLSNSLRLLTGNANGTSVSETTGKSDLKFNELNYVPINFKSSSKNDNRMNVEQQDVKPELCCRCKAIVVDRGIRKNIAEIPDSIRLPMQRSLKIGENSSNGELVFCSVNCYAASIVTAKNADFTKNGSKFEPAQGLPPISPLMEDDDDDLMRNEKKQSLAARDSTSTLDKNLFEQGRRFEITSKRKWADIKYTRWTPSYFELNKSTSPINSDDMRESSNTEYNSQCSSAQFINLGDSSIDSNESDNSTTYSQSTSSKFANNFEEPGVCNLDRSLSANVRYNGPRESTQNKDVIAPWPEGMDLIQVKPYKPIPKVKLPRESESTGEGDAELTTSSDSYEMYVDSRKCVLCHDLGDGDSDGPARLLNLCIDGWVHLNCALWSLDVYELANGALMNVELACRKAMACSLCHKPGATLKCFKPRCPNYYHFVCALKEKCSFYEDKSVQCRQHSKSFVKEMTSFGVKRRVYVNRDEQKQVAEMIQGEQLNVMRIGSLVFANIGQLLPHQLNAFHDQNNIFPVGYKVIRFYWSYRTYNKRCKYICSIIDNDGKPQFKIVAQELKFEDETFLGDSPQEVWSPIVDKIIRMRAEFPDTITTFPSYIRGADLFGLNEPSIVRILESLPGVESLTDYDFKFGRSPLLELPLAINPTGCARTEPKLRTHLKRPYTIHTASSVPKSRLQSLSSGDSSSPYIKQFVHSKSSQYRKMKSEWRNNVVLARSRVQGLGLYAARDIEKHTMVIEYIGMLIRNEIAERYEKIHEAHNRGIYMFRLDEDRVIDATLAGGLARYINHSCNPNCVAEAVEIDRERKILIIANRKILKGEELGYDYKLAIEDDQHKISCLCGAPTCKKWMN